MKPKRYSVMSVPGHLDDGSDTAWFVVDARSARKGVSISVGEGDDKREVALLRAKRLNQATARLRYDGPSRSKFQPTRKSR